MKDHQIISRTAAFCRTAGLAGANWLKATPKMATGLHIHPDILHVTFTFSGKGTCAIGRERHGLAANMVHFVYPGEAHAFIAGDVDPYHNFILKLHSLGAVPRVFGRMFQLDDLETFAPVLDELNRLLQANRSTTNRLWIESALLKLFAMLLEKVKGNDVIALDALATQTFTRAVETIQKPPFEFPGLSMLAKSAGMSERNFTRLFRRHFGLAPREFHVESKLFHAQRLLSTEHYSVKEVANMCGYVNSQNFIRAFKKRFNHTPKRVARVPS